MRRAARLTLALVLLGPGPSWAAAVSVGRAVVPPAVRAAPVPGLRLEITAPSGRLSVSLPAAPALAPSPAPAPAVAPSAPSAPSAAPVPAAAAAAPLSPALPAPSALAAAPLSPAAGLSAANDAPVPPGPGKDRAALRRLSAPAPFEAPATGDDAGQREFARRLFDFKLGRESAADLDLPPALRRAASLFRDGPKAAAASAPRAGESGSEPVSPLASIRREPPPPPVDDGGGAGYAAREIRFNGQTLPSVAFRPNVPVEALIVKAIDASRESLKIALYEFNSRAILKALQAARKRGVKVQVVLDYRAVFPHNEPGQDYKRRRSEQIWALVRDGFDLRVRRTPTEYGINHNKFLVADGKLAEFGSYNWSYTSEMSHYENIVFSDEAERVKALEGYWQYLYDGGVELDRARTHPWPSAVEPPAAATKLIEFNGVRLPAWVFTPGDRLEDWLVAGIDAARTSIDYAMFSPRSTRVIEALVRAHRRGVKVRAVIDESQSKVDYFKPFADHLAFHGIEVKTLAGPNGEDSDFPLAEKTHHKFMVLDGRLVETGSANHTKRASIDNYENAHYLDDATDAAAFQFVFKHLFGVAKPYPAPERAQLPTDEQLAEDILNPPAKPPLPPAPPEPELPPARVVNFNGRAYPSVAFRPYDPVVPHLVAAIGSAKKSVKIAIYQFEQQEVLDALKAAKKRGVEVQVVLDRSHVYTTGTSHEGGPRKPRPMVVELVKSGFDLRLLRGQNRGIQHNKFLLVDELFLETGSYNYTKQSEDDHFESVAFTTEKGRVGLYRRYFRYLRENGEEVDFDKLEEILNRTEAGTGAEDAELEPEARRSADLERDSKFPRPPVDADAPVKLHGQRFPRVIFSPQGGIEEAVVRAIDAAQVSLEVAMFSFYSRPVAEAIKRALDRGVQARVLLDRSQSALAKLDDWLSYHGVDVRLLSGPDDERDPLYQKMHNKFLIVDGAMAEFGSFNYSPNAENNSFENSNFTDEPSDVARFVAYFNRMFQQAVKSRPPRREPKWKEDAQS